MPSNSENIHDEIRQQTIKFKDMTSKQKFGYFWDYYKIPALVILLVTALGAGFLHDFMEGRRETALYAVLINANPNVDYDGLMQDFADYAGIDTKEKNVTVDSSLSIATNDMSGQSDMILTQKLMAMISAGVMDVVIADETTVRYYADAGYFPDLRAVLPEDMLEKYRDRFIYYTFDPEAKKAQAEELGISYEDDNLGPYNTLEPVPVGIMAGGFSGLPADAFLDQPVITLCVNTSQQENALEFIRFLDQE